jgi:hypothetical protein
MVLQLKNYWYLWQRSLTFTLSLLGFQNCRISFGLWFRLIRDELIEAHQDSKVGHLGNAARDDHKMLTQLLRMSHLET